MLAAKHQGFLHVLGVDAHDGADLIVMGGDGGVAQGAWPPAGADPIGGGTGFTVGRGDVDIAAEPDQIIEFQFLDEKPI